MQNNHHKEHLYKILVIGDLGVGKTSIIKRYVHHNFSPNYRATIGVDFALKVLTWDQETVRLQLWDIAGTVPTFTHGEQLIRVQRGDETHSSCLCHNMCIFLMLELHFDVF
ncbi:hypothetical protein XENOCAPTIV_004765 [Xenoophorus captivus]|uniref:Ras-related protein Rab-38 n=1 Tax=Xenoophorus captivus TaxID=1517983 RepID=A0ABV0RPK0_9TELE